MTSLDNLGPHLLKRIPSPHDPDDYKVRHWLSEDPLDVALRHVLSSWVVTKSQKELDKALVKSIHALQNFPPIVPTPPPGQVLSWWDDDDPTLDQGDTGHCVGFTGADWENALPVDDHRPNQRGHDLYYLCKDVEGEHGQENGAYVRSLMKVLVGAGQLKTYAACETMDDVVGFVTTQGPLCWGMGWTDSMFYPNSEGIVRPSGPDVGGHAIIEVAYHVDEDLHEFMNHWGPEWGVNGHFFMRGVDVANRLTADGECWAGVEVAS